MQIMEDRRALHRIPELSDRLVQTAEYLQDALSPLRCARSAPIPGAVCAFFDFGADSAIAFRSDADALPLEEKTGLPFASCHPGQMHACGHDGHMAMLLELARRLDRMERLPHNVLLIFQPAEETTGGALRICESGILSFYNVTALFGLHLWPGLPAGRLFSCKGGMMSRSCEVTVELYGRACHIAKAEEGIDALLPGAEIVRQCAALQAEASARQPYLLRFGKMESGTVRNAVSAYTRLEGSLRAFSDEQFDALLARLREIVSAAAAITGCRAAVTTSDGYPAVCNPAELFDRVRACGIAFDTLEKPVMITEDFSWYQKFVPAQFFFLGTGDTAPLHSDRFDFDENILLRGAEFWEALARGYREEAVCK